MNHERGEISLVGLLVAMLIFAVVLGATLTLFDSSTRTNRDTNERVEAADKARDAMDRIAKALRNLANPTTAERYAITTIADDDLVFKTVDPSRPVDVPNKTNAKRVRYCLRATDPQREQIIEQTQSWTTAATPAAPAAGACGTRTGWTRTEVIADRLTNRINGQDRPLFAYDVKDVAKVTDIHVTVAVDPRPGRGAREMTLSSGVFLRNQNRPPTAIFTPTVTPEGLVLNASASADPEGGTLLYHWTINGVTPSECRDDPMVCTVKLKAPVANRVVGLTVEDAGGLTAQPTPPTQTVVA
jgi:type II secretory pathway pseudopilin PulG